MIKTMSPTFSSPQTTSSPTLQPIKRWKHKPCVCIQLPTTN